MKRPLLSPIISFLAGIVLAKTLMPSQFPAIFILTAVLLVMLVFSFRSDRFFIFFLCLLFLSLGVLRYSSAVLAGREDVTLYERFSGKKVLIEGTVSGFPLRKQLKDTLKTSFPVNTSRILAGDKETRVAGKVLVCAYGPGNNPEIGDRVAVMGEISLPSKAANPYGFDQETYLSSRGIYAVISAESPGGIYRIGRDRAPHIRILRQISRARREAGKRLDKVFSGRGLDMAGALLLGQKSGMRPGTRDVFERTGTLHILAVSGLHTGIVGGVILWLLLLFRMPRKIAYLLAIAGICCFAVFAGGRPSSIRAAIMLSFVFLGVMLGRRADVVNSLGVSAFLITFFSPGRLFDPGFILSYTAVMSIIFLTPYTDVFFSADGFAPRVKGKRFAWGFRKACSLSLAVFTGMTPVVAYYFNIVTPVSMLANLIAVPALSVFLALGYTVLAAAFILPAAVAAAGLGNLFSMMSGWLIYVMSLLGSLPGAFVRVVSPDAGTVIFFYVCAACFLIILKNRKKRAAVIPVILLLSANMLIWGELSRVPPGDATITFFDAGNADAAVAEYPDGSVLLIDTGRGDDERGPAAGRMIIAPYLWNRGIRRIDGILITHEHSDHAGGAPYLLRNFRVGAVIRSELEPGDIHGRKIYGEIDAVMDKRGVKAVTVGRGDLVKGLPQDLMVFNPCNEKPYKDPNNDSVVFKLKGEKGPSVMFTADAGAKAMADMLVFGDLLKADIIKVPHHGGKMGDMSVVKVFLDAVSPGMAVITNNSYDVVNEVLLRYLRNSGIDVFVTGEDKAVIVRNL